MATQRSTTVHLHDRSDHYGGLAAAVRARRARLGLRQEELADLAGCSARFVHAVETGKPSVQLDKLLALLNALGLHLELADEADATVRLANPLRRDLEAGGA
jgi:y4mF family transcriptional regulator